MQLRINGENKNVSGVSTVADLIQSLGAKADRVAVELNRNILPKREWGSTPLHDGDTLEIVHFVGGGCPDSD